MPQSYLSTDPHAGDPIGGGYLSTDPHAGETVAATQAQPGADERFVKSGLTRLVSDLNPMPALRMAGRIATDPHGPTAGLGNAVIDVAKGAVAPLAGMPEAGRLAMRGEFGKAAGQAMESLPIVGPSIKRADDLERSGDTAGALGSVAGDAASMFVPGLVGGALRRIGQAGAGAITGADEAVSTAALENRALPGLVRSGPTRAGLRLQRVEGQATDALKGPEGQSTISPQDLRRGAATDAEWSRIRAMRDRSGPTANARQLQADAPNDVIGAPTAQNVFDRARQSRASGSTGMAAALDTDQTSAVGRAAPSVAPLTDRANAVQSVIDAYRKSNGPLISTAGLPTMQSRWAASAVNRLAGPASQGAFDVGRAIDSDPVRAAIIALLSSQQLQPMASHDAAPVEPMASHDQIDRSQWGKRADGSLKGDGFLGVLKRPDGGVSSEISYGTTDVNGKEMDIPLLVPTLTKDEVSTLLSTDLSKPDRIPKAIVQKAVAFARQRVAAGQPVFAP